MSSTIKTAIRVRPLLPTQTQQGYANSKLQLNASRSEITINDAILKKTFRCDHLIPPEATQDQTFLECGLSEMVEKVLQGYNSTVFAYGQTGSGKSYTMQGKEDGQVGGIIGRVVRQLYKRIGQIRGNVKYSVSMSYLQIYSQRIYDLMNPASLNNRTLNLGQGVEGLRLRWNKDEQFTVENLFVFECRDEHELLRYVSTGLKNRISAAHKLNLQSSRSHSILSIRVEGIQGNSSRFSRIDLVDLAGSERLSLTKTEGRQAKQSIDINKSLFTLRQVINVLSESPIRKNQQKTYVPYRDSKLTSILKQSIGGNSYCLMIACVCPNDAFIEENLSTLTYVTKASFITNNPTLNLDANSKTIMELRKQLAMVNGELDKANKHIELLSELKQRQGQKQVVKVKKSQDEMELPVPNFGKRLSESTKIEYNNNISERLIESINMVRQLLKSNKQLREKLENTECLVQQRNAQIYQLTRQNQILREGSQTIISSPQSKQSTRRQMVTLKHISEYNRYQEKIMTSQSKRHSLKVPAAISRPPTQQLRTLTSNKQVGQKLLDMGRFHLNEKGVDSAPTNFNKRTTSTSQQQRNSYQRGASQEMDRNAITAKFSRRSWMGKESDPKCFLSFYEGADGKKF